MIAFIIWSVVGAFLSVLGIIDLFSRKPAGFWANVEVNKVSDVKKYNKAVGTLLIVYGLVLILLGLPLLAGKSPLILITMLGVVFETIVTMAVYSCVISEKYKVK